MTETVDRGRGWVRWILLAVGILVGLFMLWIVFGIGTSAGGGSESAGTPLPLPAQQEPDPGMGMDAEVGGIVEFEEDTGCVVLVYEQATQVERRYPTLWPIGTTAERDPFKIVLRDGTNVFEGDSIVGGGGYPADVTATRAEELGIAPKCLTGPYRSEWGEIAVFNHGSEIAVTRTG